ncbi:GNAT family N-acetyltransferase [Rhodovastum atsumiense]|uniref:GNAT family N-acetyltransferase n=2 Tax=Rhodovastum atsumiense TaxID=504468 RepID=A0A5M6J440_9PROT|nr:GNAT family N-acetyltransferase [Rhodovastum atsumiense]
MRLWVPVLTLPAEAIAAGRVLVAAETALLGVAAHGPPVDGLAELTLLCVDPAATARGVGTALLGAVVARLRAQGVRRMTILAERGIAGFYRRMGAVPTGFAPSPAIPGRMLPSLLLELR